MSSNDTNNEQPKSPSDSIDENTHLGFYIARPSYSVRAQYEESDEECDYTCGSRMRNGVTQTPLWKVLWQRLRSIFSCRRN